MLIVTKPEIFEKVVIVDIFLSSYNFIDEIMRIIQAKLQAKILHIVRSRALGRRLTIPSYDC